MKRLNLLFTLTFLVAFLTPCEAQAQGHTLSKSDLELVKNSSYNNPTYADRQVRYGFGSNRRRWNPAYHLLSSSMYIYQRLVSPVLQRSCAFVPSCSGYSKALIKEYGLLKGTVCTADRLMRCNRISLADASNIILFDDMDGHIHESVKRYSK